MNVTLAHPSEKAVPPGIPGLVEGTVEITEDDAAQSHGTSGLQLAEGPAKTLQEQATISGAGGKGPSSQPSTGKTQIVKPTSQGSSAGTDVPGSSGTGGPETIPKQGAVGSDASESPGGSASPAAASSSVTGTVSAQSQKENAPTTTTTTTTKAPTTTTTTTTEAPTTTTTTRAPSLLRESDGSLSSSAWVCAPLLLAVSALAYTTLG
ncbi:mucin TcMUCII [Trypanosoma cruzi]|nr:mucin TcMUCII [Trypanosoma cruzi]